MAKADLAKSWNYYGFNVAS
jgi:hypothetical protein